MIGPLSLSHEFKDILDQLEYSRHNIFITGRAGTGKSTLLQLFRDTTRKRIVVLAPTGIAALNVKGQTIHSFFGFPPKLIDKSDIVKRKNFRLFTHIDMIIIDEISMVRADLIDNIDIFLRINRGIDKPFGNVQMVFFGDLFQLPPVVTTQFEKHYFSTTYSSPYFFDAHVFNEWDMKIIELHEVYRQKEKAFINLLENIRTQSFDYEDLMTLNERCVPIPEDKSYYITLCSRNDIVQNINESELRQIPMPSITHTGLVTGLFDTKLIPADLQLTIKEGAQVMFVKNDAQKRYVNGTIGIVTQCTENVIVVTVEKDNGDTEPVSVEKETWEIVKYDRDPFDSSKIVSHVVGTFQQYPIKLAWAITIHKSQGKTFDKVIIDLGKGAFESGQTYVALSRCKTFEGIVLAHPVKPRDIILDERITEYYGQIKYLN
jgi:ATP-dependent exoDNAse (exonuclease V) alpha subunit